MCAVEIDNFFTVMDQAMVSCTISEVTRSDLIMDAKILLTSSSMGTAATTMSSGCLH